MGNIRRYFQDNTPVFITATCHNRQPFLRLEDNKELLLDIMREVKQQYPFRLLA